MVVTDKKLEKGFLREEKCALKYDVYFHLMVNMREQIQQTLMG